MVVSVPALTLVLSACTPVVPPAPTAEAIAAPTEAVPALGTEANPVIFSFVPSADASKMLASAEAIAAALSEKTGLVIKAEVPTSYAVSIEVMCAGEAQVGALNTFSYVVAHERGCANVALAAVRNGSTSYSGQIVTRADSGITTLEDLKGKSFCRPDEFSTSGWIIPVIALKAAGIDPDTELGEVKDTGGDDSVIRAVYNGECDAGASFSDARTLVAEELKDVNDVVVVIAISDPIPNDTVSFAPDIPEEIRTAIVDALKDMAGNEEELKMLTDMDLLTGVESVDDSFYDPFRALLQSAGVDINAW
jgi:phosphonate transport system substrate-binding protein